MLYPEPVKNIRYTEDGRVASFTVIRSRWFRGFGPQYSVLMRRSDRLCDITGCYAKACGLDDASLIGVKSVVEIPNLPEQMQWLLRRDSPMFIKADTLAALNDYVETDNEIALDKELEIKVFFNDMAIAVFFED